MSVAIQTPGCPYVSLFIQREITRTFIYLPGIYLREIHVHASYIHTYIHSSINWLYIYSFSIHLVYWFTYLFIYLLFSYYLSPLLSSTTRRRFYPKINTSKYILFTHFTIYRPLYFSAQLVGGFILSDRLDMPWSQMLSLLPPRCVPSFLSRIGFSIPTCTARRFSPKVSNSRSRAFRQSIIMQKTVPTSMCTRWELNSRNWF